MDKQQEEMQFVGFFGIFNESYKSIISWRKIFTEITLSLILPLSIIYLVHVEISTLFFKTIMHNEIELDHTRTNTPKYDTLSDLISDEWAYYWLFKALYFTLFFIFSLLSTAAVVYTIACVYTAREVTFNKVISVVPKVWKRLMVTFICIFIAMFLYHVVAFAMLFLCVVSIGGSYLGVTVFVVLAALYLVGFFYLTVIWHLASVVSVLEDAYGLNAMVKGGNLIKGNLLVAVFIFVILGVAGVGIQFVFQRLVVQGSGMSRVGYGMTCLSLHSMLSLFGLVIQTVIYFVCKSYHHENIDKSALSDHLEVYLGEYVPLNAKDVQLQQYQV